MTVSGEISIFVSCVQPRKITYDKFISPRLMHLYRKTNYEAGGIKFTVGRRWPILDELLRKNQARIASFITAYNPRSKRKSPRWNERAQQRLRDDLRGKSSISGVGALGRWSEAHELVFGSVAPVEKLARKYRQNVIVIMQVGRPVWLLSFSSGTN
jgi:hypothetical protein